jgi:hypothetical protein
VAPTLRCCVIVTTQGPVPVQAPVHPPNTDELPGIGVSVTAVPRLKTAEHCEPHSIPAGVLFTTPWPVPASDTVKVYVDGA